MATIHHCDVAIVGGGLSGALLALALAQRRPDARTLLLDRGDHVGGNHIWSFFGSDVAAADRPIVAPAVARAWADYDVAFPRRRRTLAVPYYSVTSDALDAAVRAALPPERLLLGRKVAGLEPTAVTLADGDRVEAGGVVDCRGIADVSMLDVGWQKFVGRMLRLKRPHGAARPTIMDATVEQIDGYRFVYTLPFDAERMFVEDTYYSDTPGIDADALRARIATYAAAKGWRPKDVEREEIGCLPVVIGGDFDAYWAAGGTGVAKGGVRAGLFHPTTGYSLPDAVRLASLIAAQSDLSGGSLARLTHDHARARWRERGFYRMLDAMLFRAAEPGERYRVLERFYGLDAGLVARFYGARTTLADKARVLMGRPPVPVGRAVRAILGGAR